MDSDFSYQSTFIWKLTAQDGLLPVSNFTEEVKEDGDKKKSKQKRHQSKEQLGEITHFDQQDDDDDNNDNDDEDSEREKRSEIEKE